MALQWPRPGSGRAGHRKGAARRRCRPAPARDAQHPQPQDARPPGGIGGDVREHPPDVARREGHKRFVGGLDGSHARSDRRYRNTRKRMTTSATRRLCRRSERSDPQTTSGGRCRSRSLAPRPGARREASTDTSSLTLPRDAFEKNQTHGDPRRRRDVVRDAAVQDVENARARSQKMRVWMSFTWRIVNFTVCVSSPGRNVLPDRAGVITW